MRSGSTQPTRSGRAEDEPQLVRGRLLELVVAAVLGALVGAPANERRRVPEPITLEVVVRDLHDALQAQRLPREVLATVPARGGAGQPLPGGVRRAGIGPLRPLAPRVAIEALISQR